MALPTIKKTLTAPAAVARSCSSTADRVQRGVAVSRYRAPMSGYVTGRLQASNRSDWDLVAVDRTSGRKLATSESFGSREVVQTWVTAGQKLDFVACRRHGSARTARLTVSLLDVAPPKSLGAASLLRVRGTKDQIAKLEAAGLDVTHSRGKGWADVLIAGTEQRDLLRSSGLSSTVRVSDMQAYGARSNAADRRYTARVGAAGSPLPSGRTTYRTYADIQNELKQLVEENPGLVRPVTIGTSFQGRAIQGVEMAKDVDGADGRPTFFLMGVHHAREWPSAEAAMEYATMLATERTSTPKIASLLSRERTTVVPLINPDGYVSSRTMGQVDPNDNNPLGPDENVHLAEAIAPPGGIFAYRRKNCDGAIQDPNVPCELQWGVDNNRNYGNLWGGPARARTRPRRASTVRDRGRSPRRRRSGTTAAPVRSPRSCRSTRSPPWCCARPVSMTAARLRTRTA